ncbi:MAG: hypothetical protein ACFFFG_06710 [Candidatus Thorarchaeota archaeon]
MSDRHHQYVFIDYEGRDNLLSAEELKSILQSMENTLVLTVAARDEYFYSDNGLFEYLNLIQVFSNLGFCIVAGHPAYDTINRRIPLQDAFYKIFTQVRQNFDAELYLGAENLSSSLIDNIQNKFGRVIPFYLHGDARVYKRNGEGDSNGNQIAIYSPIAHTLSESDVLQTQKVKNYLLRRKLVQQSLNELKRDQGEVNGKSYKEIEQQVLRRHIREYILTSENLRSKIHLLRQRGATLVVGNPVIPEMTANLIKEFSIV